MKEADVKAVVEVADQLPAEARTVRKKAAKKAAKAEKLMKRSKAIEKRNEKPSKTIKNGRLTIWLNDRLRH